MDVKPDSRRRRGHHLPAALLLLTLSALSLPVLAQSGVISPEHIARLKQQTDFSDDWSSTPYYNLDNPVELKVTVEGVQLFEQGNAELYFSIRALGRGFKESGFDRDQVYVATLQSTAGLAASTLDPRDLRIGQKATLTGWPATDLNTTDSVLLVDDIDLIGNGGRHSLHPRHANMKQLEQADPPPPDS